MQEIYVDERYMLPPPLLSLPRHIHPDPSQQRGVGLLAAVLDLSSLFQAFRTVCGRICRFLSPPCLLGRRVVAEKLAPMKVVIVTACVLIFLARGQASQGAIDDLLLLRKLTHTGGLLSQLGQFPHTYNRHDST